MHHWSINSRIKTIASLFGGADKVNTSTKVTCAPAFHPAKNCIPAITQITRVEAGVLQAVTNVFGLVTELANVASDGLNLLWLVNGVVLRRVAVLSHGKAVMPQGTNSLLHTLVFDCLPQALLDAALQSTEPIFREVLRVLCVVGNPLHDLLYMVWVLELEWSLCPGVQGHD